MGHNRPLINLNSRPHCTLRQIFTPQCISHLKSYLVILSKTGQQRRLLSKVQIKQQRMIENGKMTIIITTEKFKPKMNSSFYRKLNSKDFKSPITLLPGFLSLSAPVRRFSFKGLGVWVPLAATAP